MNTSIRLVTAAGLVLLWGGLAYPQERQILQLQADVVRLSQQVSQLQRSIDENNAIIQGLVENVFDQVNGLASDFQRINQTMETVKTSSDRTDADLRGLVQDISNLSEALTAVQAQLRSVAQQITAMTTTAQPLSIIEDLRRTAMTDYLAGNYELAIAGFKEFLSSYPGDPQAYEVQLVLGDAYYNQQQYEQAVIEYDLFLQKYPENDKTRAALYKKGLALAELNQSQQALTALRKVVSDYPNTSEAANAEEKIRQLDPAQR